MKQIFKFLLTFSLIFSLLACAKVEDSNDIIIIYTNDVHCGLDDDIGYAGLVAFKNEALTHSKYVTLVDAGDAVQGSAISSVSKGEAIVECLNVVGYDILTFGNHEFDYGYKRLNEIVNSVNTPYLNSNIVYTGNDSSISLNSIEKYKIIEYGDKKVAYISLLTPRTLIESSPVNFKDNDEYVIDLTFNDDSSNFYNNIQKLVDQCRNEGADYVICLSHFGSNESYKPYSSIDLVESTSGIDVIIDAHEHEEASCKELLNKDNETVIVTSSGTKLNNIGQITISPSGYITTTIISEYAKKDQETQDKIVAIKEKYSSDLDNVIFVNDTPLSINDADGIRVIRNKEMPIANMICDSIRYAANSDIAICNGGGVRTDLNTGNVSMTDIINVLPFGNRISAIEMTGQEIVEYLEYATRYTKIKYIENGKSNCEYGSFMHVSGLKYTVDTSKEADLETSDVDNLIKVNSINRVQDVMVLNENGEYEPIDLEKTYIVGGNDYTLLYGGSGTETFLADHKVIIQDAGEDYVVLHRYITDVLNCDLSKYATTDDRINLK